ncbi:MAG: FAD:protein FMN transferase [Ruminiclostridium sp.]
MKRYIALIICCLFMFTGCDEQKQNAEKTVFAFDTLITAKIYGSDKEKLEEALENSFTLIEKVEQTASALNPESELYKLNQTAYNNPVTVSDMLFELIETGIEWAEKTDGALDITIGKLVDLWGIGTENQRVPTDEEIQSVLTEKGFEKVMLDRENKTVMFTDKNIKLNLGAIAKGYAGELIRESLIQSGVTEGTLNLGGNIVTIGLKNGSEKWKIGVTDPNSPDMGIIAKLKVGQAAVVTSGDYERYFEQNGVRYCHIFDGKTGYPALSGLKSVTIICDNSFTADCLSTACFVLGKEKAAELIQGLENVSAVFVDTSDNMTTINIPNGEIEIYG